MSFFDQNFKKKISKRIDESIKYRETLTIEQLKEIMPKVKEFYLNKENIGFYNDGIRDFVIIKTPTEEMGGPKQSKSQYGDEPQYHWFCQTPTGVFITVFGTQPQFESMGFNSVVCITGRVRTQYQLLNEQGYYKSVSDLCKKTGYNEETITEDDYRERYSINVIQVIK